MLLSIPGHERQFLCIYSFVRQQEKSREKLENLTRDSDNSTKILSDRDREYQMIERVHAKLHRMTGKDPISSKLNADAGVGGDAWQKKKKK